MACSIFFFFFFQTHADPQLSICKCNSYSMFKLVLLHLSDQEVCNVYRSRGNTTAACKHVTIYFLFFVFLSFFKLYCSSFFLFFLTPLFRSLWIQSERQLVLTAEPGYWWWWKSRPEDSRCRAETWSSAQETWQCESQTSRLSLSSSSNSSSQKSQ